ncbi:hypothetical protein BsWGS_05384 [Bradybaena similaris]
MVLTSQNACEILGLPSDPDRNSISTRYKQLAIRWHPEKHKCSTESVKKFKQISLAYRKLTSPDFNQDLNMNDCYSLFQQVVFKRSGNNDVVYDQSDLSDDSDDDDDDSDDSDSQLPNNHFHKKDHSSNYARSETSTKDMTEEERERRRAEKRRAKKKRQRERKRLEKEQKSNGTTKNKKEKKLLGQEKTAVVQESSSSEDDTLFDPKSAFFTKVLSKKRKNGPGGDQLQLGRKEHAEEKRSDDEIRNTEEVDPKVLRSRQLAIRGNEMAQVEEYTAAIQLFTEAINLDQTDFRFFGNRSYCYDRIEQYDRALRDAERAIKLDKEWPKGYFRQGRALAGLKMYVEAETAFMQVLKLDKNCDDAHTELLRVKTHQLMDMGFSQSQSEAAIKKYGSVQAALDSLLAGVADTALNDLYISDDDDDGFNIHRPAPIPPPVLHPTDTKMDPTNPEGLTALWVGNVLPAVTEKKLTLLFSKYGQVTSIRLLPEKYCAFVNFKTKEAAGRAMHQLQGMEVEGQKLLIKFPDNPLANNPSNLTTRKNLANGSAKQGRTHKKPVS